MDEIELVKHFTEEEELEDVEQAVKSSRSTPDGRVASVT